MKWVILASAISAVVSSAFCMILESDEKTLTAVCSSTLSTAAAGPLRS